MWLLWIWPAICIVVTCWAQWSYALALVFPSQIPFLGGALFELGNYLILAGAVGSMVLYTLFVSLQTYIAVRTKKKVQYWLSLLFGPLSAVLALFFLFLWENI